MDSPPPVRPLPLPLPQTQCPLCGGPNGCVAARSGNFTEPCWCRDVAFAAALLAKVADGQRGLSCICRRCASPSTAR